MLKENTVITLHPEDMFQLHAILLDDQEKSRFRQQAALPLCL